MTTAQRIITLIFLALSMAHVGFSASRAQAIDGVDSASHKLGFSGATVSVRERYRQTKWPIAQRTFVLIGANGHTISLKLQDGGGTARNSSLNLFKADEHSYLLISERDCVDFDPVELKAKFCQQRPPCDGNVVRGPIYLGRFDWMNGFDPPNGAFGLRFRFGPFEDAVEGGSCPTTPAK